MRSEGTAWRSRSFRLVALILVGGLVASAAATLGIRRVNHEDAEDRFDETALQLDEAVQTQLNDYIDKLRDIGTHAAVATPRQPEKFRSYVDGSRIFTQLPAVSSVFFMRRVDDADMASYRSTLTAEGHDTISFGDTPAGTTHYVLEDYVPGSVDLGLPLYTDIAPLSSVSPVLDAAGEQELVMAGTFQDDPFVLSLTEAADAPIPLLEQILAVDFFIGVPIYDASATGPGSGAPVGWVGGSVGHFTDLIASLSDSAPPGYGLQLSVDLTSASTGGNPNGPAVRESSDEAPASGPGAATFTNKFDFETEGVSWHLSLWSPADSDTTSPLVLLTFLVGVMATLLFARLVQTRARALSREREHALAIQENERFQTEILNSVTEPVVVLDSSGHVVQHNHAWDSSIVAAPDTASGDAERPLLYLDALAPLAGSRGSAELEAVVRQVLEGTADTIETDVFCSDDRRTWWWLVRVHALRGPQGGAVVTHSDITERKQSHDDLAVLATRDSLTGLRNRRAFSADLDHALDVGRMEEQRVGVIFIDLDGFKAINDQHGHAAGDAVLQTVASRLASSVRAADQIARLGGDEFVVLVWTLPDRATIEATARRILAALDESIQIDGRHGTVAVSAQASIGAAVSEWTDTGDDLLDRADRAMYLSKQRGGSQLTLA